MLKYSVRHRLINHNPARDVAKLKHSGEPRKEMAFLAPQEIKLPLEHSEPRYRVLFRTAILIGMRQGEPLALTWDDITWHNGRIRVSRTFNRGGLYEPKSQASRRKIAMPPQLVSELKRWRLASPSSQHNLVFANNVGGYEDGRNVVKRAFLPVLRRAGLRKVCLHELRHTYQALLMRLREHPKYTQAQMGHSSIIVTMDVYGHLMDSANQDAAATLGKVVLGGSGNKMVTSADPEEGADALTV